MSPRGFPIKTPIESCFEAGEDGSGENRMFLGSAGTPCLGSGSSLTDD